MVNIRHCLSGRFLILALLTQPFATLAAGIDRIDPPSWWTGLADGNLQLMVYGEGIAGFEPSLDAPGVVIDRVVRGDSPNYLFVYLEIGPGARAGTVEINFAQDDESLSYEYELRERPRDPHVMRSFSAADAIYLITPDRFANGDPSNDTVAGYADVLDRDEAFGRHGGDLAGILEHLDYIASMGFTQIWLNPVLENAMPEASYHGYATTDYYKVDPRFGSNAEYLKLADAARARGLGLIMDMIVNHIGSGHPWVADPPTDDWLHAPHDIRITSHARTTHQDPYASEYDRRALTDGWFVESMPDLNQRNPLLADYLCRTRCGGSNTSACPASARTPGRIPTRNSLPIGHGAFVRNIRTSTSSGRSGAGTRPSSAIGRTARRTTMVMHPGCPASWIFRCRSHFQRA